MDFEIDTNLITDASKDINILVSEIKEIFEDTFDTIDNMVSKNNIWLGNSAAQFRNIALVEKHNYIVLKDSLNKYGNYLNNYGAEMNMNIVRMKR